MPVSYIDHIMYSTAPEGLEYMSLLGNSLRLSSAVVAGATSLPVQPAGSGGTATNADVTEFQVLTIYDGLNSEQVLVASDTTFPASSIPLLTPGCLYNHAQYTPCSSPGVVGDLGGEILKASAWVENITKQSLWSTTQTETLRIPTMRASFDNQNVLTFRTRQYPITAISALSLGTTQANFVSYDPTQCFIDANELVTVPVLQTVGSGTSTWPLLPNQINRQSNGYLNITYSAGYTAANLPADVKDACILLVNSLLARRQNAGGWDSLRLGDKQIQATQRGDNSGEGLWIKQARNLLSNYTLRMF